MFLSAIWSIYTKWCLTQSDWIIHKQTLASDGFPWISQEQIFQKKCTPYGIFTSGTSDQICTETSKFEDTNNFLVFMHKIVNVTPKGVATGPYYHLLPHKSGFSWSNLSRKYCGTLDIKQACWLCESWDTWKKIAVVKDNLLLVVQHNAIALKHHILYKFLPVHQSNEKYQSSSSKIISVHHYTYHKY